VRSTEASIRNTPTIADNVAVAVINFAGSPSGTTRPSCVPARIASVPEDPAIASARASSIAVVS